MKKEFKISPKKLAEYKAFVVKRGYNKISSLQVGFGLSYEKAYKVFTILNKDTELLELTQKYQRERPKKIKEFTKLVIKELGKGKNEKYVNWDDLCAKLNMQYDYAMAVRIDLQHKKILSEDRIYLILKK